VTFGWPVEVIVKFAAKLVRGPFADASVKDPLSWKCPTTGPVAAPLVLKLNVKGIDLAKFSFDPHIAIGMKLSSHQFPFAVEEFTGKQYGKNFRFF